MTAAAAPPPASADAPDPAAERVARQCRVLEELAEIGLALARTLLRRAEAAADAPGAADGESVAAAAPLHGDPGLTFDRLSRAIRLTQRLETEIAQGEVVRQTRTAEARAKAALAADDARWDAWTEAQNETVLAVVEKTLEADGQDDETIIDRLREARDWLECDDDFNVLGLPVGLVIDRICKAFNVTPDWSLWADEPWAIEEAQDRPRGSPYARGGFRPADDDGGAEAGLAEPVGGSP